MANQTNLANSKRSLLDTRIKSANTQMSEKWLGYFAGPCLMYMAFYAVGGRYLTQFYTDVLGMSGIFLTWMPFISKVVDAITNIIMGRIIDRTRSRHGKARPWLLVSGPLIAVTGILLYAIPRTSAAVQIIWIVVSYNLFFSLAFTIYNMSHALMVPLSTRNTKQRDTLALLSKTGADMIPGMLISVIMPIIIRSFGVGSNAQDTWIQMMSILSVLAIPATLLEYYFTKERVTAESMEADGTSAENSVTFRQQMTACFKNPYWLIIMGSTLVLTVCNTLSNNSMIYYCNWVLGNSIDSGAAKQVIVNMIGQAPLGIGLFLLWPLVHKFGKRRVMMVGFGVAAVGCLLVLINRTSMTMVLAGLIIKSFGALPMYVVMAQLAESLDHIEWKNRFRADGFSASVYSIILTVSQGIAQSILLGGITAFGYIAPESSGQVLIQPAAIQTFFTWGFIGIPMAGYLIGSLLMIPFDVEDKIPQISADITARHKAEAEARGEIYYSPEEKAAMEQAEQEKISEAKRIEELKARCARKGLDFAGEERKYQEKQALKQAKNAAKAAKKK